MKPADRAWIALGVGVIAYDVTCPPGETLSEGVDRYLVSHRRLVYATTLTLVIHLCNLCSPAIDPVHWGFVGMRKLRRTRPTLRSSPCP